MPEIDVCLEPDEFVAAVSLAALRNALALLNRQHARQQASRSAPRSVLSDHILGACGEIAVAKLVGVYYRPTVNTFTSTADIPSLNADVRTATQHHYDFCVFPKDDPDRQHWCVTGEPPKMKVWGSILGRDAQREEWWRKPYPGAQEPCWMVPKQFLTVPDIGRLRLSGLLLCQT